MNGAVAGDQAPVTIASMGIERVSPSCVQALPEFTAPGEERSVSFKKMLANTCQQEYEATEQAREVSKGIG